MSRLATTLLPWGLRWPWQGRDRRDGDELTSERGSSAAPDGADAAQAGGIAQGRFGGDEDPETDWVTVHVASGLEEAHIFKGVLEAEDIPVLLRVDSMNTVVGVAAGYGVRVQVPRTLAERAETLLATDDASSSA